MEDQTDRSVDLLASLALEYQKKYRELEQFARELPAEKLPQQLKALAESATDRFRSAQMLLTRRMSTDVAFQSEETLQMLRVIFQCFDEMRIIFLTMLEHLPPKGIQL